MALRTFNSVGGFSVGENSQQIITKDGNITAVEANVSGNVNVIGNVAAANVTILGTLTAPLIDGILVANAASQPNIHTVGNLTNLAVDGNVEIGGTATITGNVEIIGNLAGSNAGFTNLSVANLSVVNADITGNLTGIDLVNSDVANIVQLNANTANITNAFVTIANVTTLNATDIANVANLTTANAAITTANVTTGNIATLESANATITAAAITTANVTTGNIATLESANATITNAFVTTGNISTVNSENANVTGLLVANVANLTTLNVSGTSTLGNVVVAADSISAGNLNISATGTVKIGNLTMPQTDGANGAVMTTDGTGNVTFKSLSEIGATGNAIVLGTPTTGNLVNNNPAITTWLTTTKVTDAVDKLNEVLGKLVPAQPPTFPNNTTLAINSLAPGGAMRITDFTQTDNTATGSKQKTGGTSVSNYKRVTAYDTNLIANVGPGFGGTVTAVKNGVTTGSRDIVEGTTNNGTYSDLVISNNVDYGTISGGALLFWYSFSAKASGTVGEGWNEVFLTDTEGTANSSTATWYYDASTPGTPVVTKTAFTAPTANAVTTTSSSGIPHYNSNAQFTLEGTVNKLSGDFYPSSDTFLTGTAGGQFQAPVSKTYAAVGVTTPLERNLYVSSGSQAFTTTANVANVTGSSATGPSISAINGYATGSLAFAPGATILTINAADTSKPNENNIPVGITAGAGDSFAVRTGGLAGTDTPSTGSVAAWTSASALSTTDATVVGGAIKQDKTNYSTGYLPVGPDLSTQATTQYITFRIKRSAVSKFDISLTGKISGCWVSIPGSTIDTTAAGTNGWVDMSVAYAGAGIPGNGAGGNGSNGCALAGTMTLNSQATQSRTATFGTASSTNSTGNYIYVRFKLATGDSITALSFPNPTH
jgi:hypothetical protein